VNLSLPTSIKAAVLHDFKDLAKNLAIEQRPLPSLKQGQLLIRMAAASINPSDLVFLRHQYGIEKTLPVIPGFEGSGMVVQSKAGWYGRWLIGKRVACHAPEAGDGTWAEYMVCTPRECMPLQKTVSLEQGASLLINPFTALLLLEKVRQKDHRAFVQTAAGSAVGKMLARMASTQGIPAIHIVRRAEQAQELRAQGLKNVLDSSDPEFSHRLKTLATELNASLLLDAVGGALTGVITAALPAGSEVLVYGALSGEACSINPTDFIFQKKSISGFWLTDVLRTCPSIKKWTTLRRAQSLLSSDLATTVQAHYPLEKIHEALQHYKMHRAKGKILLVYAKN